MAHRDDLAAVDADFVHLFSSWFNRGFLVLRRIDWSTPASILEKIIRYEAVHAIQRLGRSAPPHRSARPALLRVLPSGAGRRAADLRRGRADPRASRRDRADPVDASASGSSRTSATTAVFYSISNCQRGLGRRLVRQFPDQAGGGGDLARDPAAVDLRHAVAGAGLRRLARARARVDEHRSRSATEDRAALAALDRAGLVARSGDRASGARAAAARGGLVLPARQDAARRRRSIRSRASISATARGWSGSTCSPTARSGRCASRTA